VGLVQFPDETSLCEVESKLLVLICHTTTVGVGGWSAEVPKNLHPETHFAMSEAAKLYEETPQVTLSKLKNTTLAGDCLTDKHLKV
jgi:hypothetical protein